MTKKHSHYWVINERGDHGKCRVRGCGKERDFTNETVQHHATFRIQLKGEHEWMSYYQAARSAIYGPQWR